MRLREKDVNIVFRSKLELLYNKEGFMIWSVGSIMECVRYFFFRYYKFNVLLIF